MAKSYIPEEEYTISTALQVTKINYKGLKTRGVTHEMSIFFLLLLHPSVGPQISSGSPTSGLTGSSIPTTQMAVRSLRMLFSSSQWGSGSAEKSR